jgi:aminoglycoside phosphotransferase (APT) family kinase protein
MDIVELTSTQAATGEDKALRQSVEGALGVAGESGALIVAIRRRTFSGSTSYAVEIVTAQLESGDAIEIFLKDYGRSSLPKPAAASRRERELRVYEELLEDKELGTARFYGACRDETAARFWLLLEFVDGELLRDCNYESWPAAAGWLGRLHGKFGAERDRLRASGFLLRHDAAFFVQAAENALEALSGLSSGLAGRLASVLEGYDAIVAVLSREPETLVHGSYRPQNVLVDRSCDPARICPTDWELAAFGRRSYDLAFLYDGFRPPRLDELFDAYEREAERFGIAPRDRDELRHEVDCFRLHKSLNSLGHLRQWPHPEETAAKVVATAEEIARTLA